MISQNRGFIVRRRLIEVEHIYCSADFHDKVEGIKMYENFSLVYLKPWVEDYQI